MVCCLHWFDVILLIMSAPRLLVRSAARASIQYTPKLAAQSTFLSTRLQITRQFSISSHLNMPDQLKPSEVNSQTDPSVAKQYDTETDKVTQIKDFFSLADEKKIGILNTYRNGVGM